MTAIGDFIGGLMPIWIGLSVWTGWRLGLALRARWERRQSRKAWAEAYASRRSAMLVVVDDGEIEILDAPPRLSRPLRLVK